MIGSGLKKLAKENGMKVAKGVAYGGLRGYAATLSEGSGYKQIVLTTKFTDPAKLNELQAQVNGRNISRELRVQNLTFAPDGVRIVFLDNPGTMKKIEEFITWFFPLLDASSATKADICTECGIPITGGCWKLVDGTAYHLHEACAQKLQRSVAEEEQSKKDSDNGSYVKGLLGALGGSALGAIVWAVVLCMGYVASLVGLLIGWLAEKGYNLLHGKQGKGKIVILVIAIVLGVVLGTFGAYGFSLWQAFAEYDMELTFADIPAVITLLLEDPEFVSGAASDILQGLLFAALGVVALLVKAGKDVSGTKIVDLE